MKKALTASFLTLSFATMSANAQSLFSHTFDGSANEVGPALQAFTNGVGTNTSDINAGTLFGSGNGAPGFNTVSGMDLSSYSGFTVEFVVESNFSGIVGASTNGVFFGITNSTTSNATDGTALYNNAGSSTGTAIGLQYGNGRGVAGADFALDEVNGNGSFTAIDTLNATGEYTDDATNGYVISITYALDSGTGNTAVTITSAGLANNISYSTVAATNYAALASLVTPNISTQNGLSLIHI